MHAPGQKGHGCVRFDEFFEEIPADLTLSVSYRTVIEDPGAMAASIGQFLGLADASPISDFLMSQRRAPTPFSDPVTDIADLYVVPGASTGEDRLLALAGTVAKHLGYAAA